MAKTEITINLESMPKTLAALRRELARITREVGDAEADPRVGRRLREIADAFEAGQSPDGGRV